MTCASADVVSMAFVAVPHEEVALLALELGLDDLRVLFVLRFDGRVDGLLQLHGVLLLVARELLGVALRQRLRVVLQPSLQGRSHGLVLRVQELLGFLDGRAVLLVLGGQRPGVGRDVVFVLGGQRSVVLVDQRGFARVSGGDLVRRLFQRGGVFRGQRLQRGGVACELAADAAVAFSSSAADEASHAARAEADAAVAFSNAAADAASHSLRAAWAAFADSSAARRCAVASAASFAATASSRAL